VFVIKAAAASLVVFFILVAHLGRDRRKAKSALGKAHVSARQKNHGNRYKRSVGGKRILTYKGGSKSPAKTSSNAKASKGNAKEESPKETPDPGQRLKEAVRGTDVSDKQADYLKDLLDKSAPTGPYRLKGDKGIDTHVGRPATMDGMLNHAMNLNAPLPKNKQEASKLIDDLKNTPSLSRYDLEDDEMKENPDDFPTWYPPTVAALQRKYGDDMKGLTDAVKKRWDSIAPEERETVLGRGDGELYRRRVLNPLLIV